MITRVFPLELLANSMKKILREVFTRYGRVPEKGPKAGLPYQLQTCGPLTRNGLFNTVDSSVQHLLLLYVRRSEAKTLISQRHIVSRFVREFFESKQLRLMPHNWLLLLRLFADFVFITGIPQTLEDRREAPEWHERAVKLLEQCALIVNKSLDQSNWLPFPGKRQYVFRDPNALPLTSSESATNAIAEQMLEAGGDEQLSPTSPYRQAHQPSPPLDIAAQMKHSHSDADIVRAFDGQQSSSQQQLPQSRTVLDVQQLSSATDVSSISTSTNSQQPYSSQSQMDRSNLPSMTPIIMGATPGGVPYFATQSVASDNQKSDGARGQQQQNANVFLLRRCPFQDTYLFALQSLALLAEVALVLLDVMYRNEEKRGDAIASAIEQVVTFSLPILKARGGSAITFAFMRAAAHLYSGRRPQANANPKTNASLTYLPTPLGLVTFVSTRPLWKGQVAQFFFEAPFFQLNPSSDIAAHIGTGPELLDSWSIIVEHLISQDKSTLREVLGTSRFWNLKFNCIACFNSVHFLLRLFLTNIFV